MIIAFLFVFGLIIGSFLTAYTYRLPREISIAKGRSWCDKCKYELRWYDNIPLFSYLLLGGRCRNCRKKISARYPLIELTTALFFVSIPLLSNSSLSQVEFYVKLIYLIVLATISIGIIVIDAEHQIIPDEFVWAFFLVSMLVFVFFGYSDIFERLLSGFAAAIFLLTLNLVTKGKGMGLGDVKLAIPLGFVLGFPSVVVWLFVSFLLGSIFGIFFILLGKTKLKAKIAFGPFLVLGFWVTLFFAPLLIKLILPYYI